MALEEKVTFAVWDSVCVLAAPADLDPYTVPAFRDAHVELVSAGHCRQVVDLSATTYIDSAGLGVLIGALKRVRAHEGWLRLAAPNENLRRVLNSTGLYRVFDIYGTVEAALITARTHTPPTTVIRDDGTTATRHTMQRSCNGCGLSLGDANEQELEAAVSGAALPDVRAECPNCTRPRPLSVGEAIIALVPGAEGAGVRP